MGPALHGPNCTHDVERGSYRRTRWAGNHADSSIEEVRFSSKLFLYQENKSRMLENFDQPTFEISGYRTLSL